jgi:hypothetical protein
MAAKPLTKASDKAVKAVDVMPVLIIVQCAWASVTGSSPVDAKVQMYVFPVRVTTSLATYAVSITHAPFCARSGPDPIWDCKAKLKVATDICFYSFSLFVFLVSMETNAAQNGRSLTREYTSREPRSQYLPTNTANPRANIIC